MYEPDDKEAMNDKILEMLGGEVDDYTAEGLPDEEKPAEDSRKDGVEISIVIKPKGAEAEAEGAPKDEGKDEDGEHDEIAHALGMHDGGCVYSK